MKNKKVISFIIAMIMILQLVMPSNFTSADPIPGDDVTSDVEILDSSYIVITDSLGNIINPVGGQYKDIPKDAKIKIRYNFLLPDDDEYNEYDFKVGDYFKVTFPDEINFQEITDKPFESGGVNGTLNLKNHVATILFTELDASNVSGFFEVEGQFIEDLIDEDNLVEIDLGYVGGIINIKFKDTPLPDVNVAISKTGSYDSVTNKITWTIIVTPEALAKGVTVVDTLSSNQDYVDNSLKVYKDTVDVTSASGITIVGKIITYKFSGKIEGEHKIIFETLPTSTAFNAEKGPNGKVKFDNTAAVKLGDKDKGSSTSSIELDWIKKTGVKDLTDGKLINWEITVNNDNNSITNAVLTDIIPAGLELQTETIKIKIGNGTETIVSQGTANGEYTYLGNILTYKFAGNLNEKAVLKYSTKVTDAKAYNQNDAITYTNNASLTWEDNVYGVPSSSMGVSIGTGNGIIDKKDAGQFNFKNTSNEINWTIVVNNNKTEITNPVLTDVIPLGLEYIPSSFTISPVNAEGVFNYVANSTTNSGIITYNFNKKITDKYTITFKTKITDYSKLFVNGKPTFSNSATLSGEELVGKKQTNGATQTISSEVINKKVKENYNYTTRKVRWEIVVNRNLMELNNAVLKDTIPEGMEFLPDSFTVSPSIIEQEDRGLSSEGNTFTYRFPATINTQYTITFDTIVKEDFLLKQENLNKELIFENKSDLTADGFSNKPYSNATATVKNYVIQKESNYLNGADYIEWSVPINKNYVTLNDIEISDTLQNGLELDVSSVKLYNATTNSSTGNLIKGEEVLDGYEINYVGKKFTLKINGETKTPFILEFVTLITDDNLKKVNNTINFLGSGKTANAEVKNLIVAVSEYGTGISGETGSITITKVDADDQTKVLSGAKFRAYRLFKGIEKWSKEDITNEFGRIEYDELLYKTHYIKEITPPSGYLLNQDILALLINKNNKSIDYTLTNKKALGDIKLIKKTNTGSPLSGAEFTLYKGDEVVGIPVTSDEDGGVVFNGIEPGIYTVKETKAPNGYNMINDDISVEISISQDMTFVEVKYNGELSNEPYVIENELVDVYGNIIINKVDSKGNALSGSEFKLYSSSDLSFENPIRTVLSDENGKVIFDHMDLGAYVIKETKATDGYYKSSDVIITEITRNANLTYTDIKYKVNDGEFTESIPEVKNESIIVELSKQDTSENPLSGAEFTLYNENNSAVQVITSNDFGEVKFENIPIGKYTIKETKAPSRYYISEDVVNVEVKKSDSPKGTEIIVSLNEVLQEGVIVIVNKKIPAPAINYGNIAIKKTDTNKNVLSGAEFTLYDEKGSVIQKGITGKDGIVSFKEILEGKYSIIETKAPEGYESSNEEIFVTVNKDKTSTLIIENKLKEIVAPIINGSIVINKVDESSKALEGAEFTLYNKDKQVIGTAVSNKNGKVIFDTLSVGTYYVKETIAPEGYELVTTEKEVEVVEAKIYSFKFKNVPKEDVIEDPDVPMGWDIIDDPDIPQDNLPEIDIPKEDKLPDTGNLLNTWILAVIGTLLTLSGIVLLKRRKNKIV